MKMRGFSIFTRLIALGLVSVFTYTSCSMPMEPGHPAGDSGYPEPKGTPIAFYLDENGKSTATDTGVTALAVTGNKALEGTLIVSEALENKGVVRFLVAGSDASVSMYFDGDHRFPDRLILNQGGELAYGKFSPYNEGSQTYDVEISVGADKDSLTGIVLNKAIFSVYQNDPVLDDSQNLRMSRLITALGVWASIDYAANDSMARDFFSDIGDFFGGIGKGVGKVFATVVSVFTIVLTVAAVVVTAIFLPDVLPDILPVAIHIITSNVNFLKEIWIEDGKETDKKDGHVQQGFPRIYVRDVSDNSMVPNNGGSVNGSNWASKSLTTTTVLKYKLEIVDNTNLTDSSIVFYKAGADSIQSVSGTRTALSGGSSNIEVRRLNGNRYDERTVLLLIGISTSSPILINDERAVLDAPLYGNLLVGTGKYCTTVTPEASGYYPSTPNNIGDLSGVALLTIPLELN